jgi:hypothetical protein
MNIQKAVTTTLKNAYDQTIVIRQCNEPTQQSLKIYNALNFKSKPFSRKKFVVPPDKILKIKARYRARFDGLSCNVG